ncbi:unnamed protein product [Symbiodinium sp. CCMP2456]|nr:unnamed protein product [Symbiodinium sp. CCMP2456]
MGFVFSNVLQPDGRGASATKSQLSEEKPHCTSKSWMILPFAFLTGGLINIDGFASTAVLLL